MNEYNADSNFSGIQRQVPVSTWYWSDNRINKLNSSLRKRIGIILLCARQRHVWLKCWFWKTYIQDHISVVLVAHWFSVFLCGFSTDTPASFHSSKTWKLDSWWFLISCRCHWAWMVVCLSILVLQHTSELLRVYLISFTMTAEVRSIATSVSLTNTRSESTQVSEQEKEGLCNQLPGVCG